MNSISYFLEHIRLPGDIRSDMTPHPDAGRYVGSFFLNDLLVQQDVLPGISKVLDVVCDRLQMRRESLSAFVYASPFCQAECHPAPEGRCVIRLSSALVESFDEGELMFVVGHEIGHFLLGHLIRSVQPSEENLEEIMISRRRELSVDRVGLLACDSLPIALSSMMKTISGLSSKHLNFNVASFISQLGGFEKHGVDESNAYRSHPSFILRSRALLKFSMCTEKQNGHSILDQRKIDQINSSILKDLEKYIDKPILDAINNCAEDYAFWRMASEIVKQRSFTKKMQQRFAERFGLEMTEKLKSMLSGLTQSEAIAHSEAYFQQAFNTFHKIAPLRADMTIQQLTSEIDVMFVD